MLINLLGYKLDAYYSRRAGQSAQKNGAAVTDHLRAMGLK
jgi:hypothetical protein